MKFEKLDLTKPFYIQWKEKYWKSRQKIEIVKQTGEDFIMKFYPTESFRPEHLVWSYWDSNREPQIVTQALDWFRNREKEIRQPKELLQ